MTSAGQQSVNEVSTFAEEYWKAAHYGAERVAFSAPQQLDPEQVWPDAINPNVMGILATSLWRIDVHLADKLLGYLWVAVWADGRLTVERDYPADE